MDLYTFDTVMLIKSDTNGVYLEIFGRGCGQWTGRTDFGPRIAKECFYDYFGHVLFLSVFPRRQSIMYNQPPPSLEIETMFTGLASRIITISYNWSLLNRLLLWKWLQIAKLCHWPLKNSRLTFPCSCTIPVLVTTPLPIYVCKRVLGCGSTVSPRTTTWSRTMFFRQFFAHYNKLLTTHPLRTVVRPKVKWTMSSCLPSSLRPIWSFFPW